MSSDDKNLRDRLRQLKNETQVRTDTQLIPELQPFAGTCAPVKGSNSAAGLVAAEIQNVVQALSPDNAKGTLVCLPSPVGRPDIIVCIVRVGWLQIHASSAH